MATIRKSLLTAADPPVLFYAKGRVELLNRPGLAIVGSRNATKQGEATAAAFAAALSGAGLTIVSGLALGIDAAAHRGALTARGSTIAVIGTGADRIYPSRNEGLAREIAQQGVVDQRIPARHAGPGGQLPAPQPPDRRSGARLPGGGSRRAQRLADHGAAGGRGRPEVFAIPGSIHSPLSKGCHKLIKQGAKLVESAQDILEELRWEAVVAAAPPAAATPADPEAARLLEVLGYQPCDLDTLAARSDLTAEQLLAMLLPLELDGHVAQLPGGRYQRIP